MKTSRVPETKKKKKLQKKLYEIKKRIQEYVALLKT